ncbi:hypothetical protein B5M09_011348 [Aphanomyces astaci]|uniref:Uncharacterized protein n=1 Tax=Aphanomyces astaci TaxID=112090 RepID=A0A3R7YGI6_APHAT|nr:hypothetical protein B5M09_011348 [Aphanomyces astaci]
MTMHVHVCGSAVDAEFQQVKAVLEGLSAVHDNMHVHVTEGNSSLQIQVTTAPPGPTSTVTSLQDLLPLLRTHVSFVTPSTSIAAQPIGPVVFYAGFTRAFLDQPDPARASLDLLRQVVHAVDAISVGKRIVIIDGVGYPAVGSICGVSNADIAAALQPISVLLVGKKGVGDAVDSFNLNATYFSSRHVRVLGGIFNRLPAHGYYSLDQCKAAVTTYFAKMSNLDGYKAYGFVPELDPTTSAISPPDEWHAIVHAMMQHVDVRGIVADASAQATRKRRRFGKLHDDQYDDVTMHIAEPIELDTFKKPRNELTIQWKAAAQAAARHMGAPSSA